MNDFGEKAFRDYFSREGHSAQDSQAMAEVAARVIKRLERHQIEAWRLQSFLKFVSPFKIKE